MSSPSKTHYCYNCEETMSDADFQKGKQCCDKPLFEDYEFQCEDCDKDLKPCDKFAEAYPRCYDCFAYFYCALCALKHRGRHGRYCASCFGKHEDSDSESDSSSETSSESEDSDDEETPDQWFDRKYPNCACHRCEKKLNARTVVFCAGDTYGQCETWFCKDCHAEGTHDCPCANE